MHWQIEKKCDKLADSEQRNICAVLAQSVERRLGKAEVGGSSPLDSSSKLNS